VLAQTDMHSLVVSLCWQVTMTFH